jgi:hypothetical protein
MNKKNKKIVYGIVIILLLYWVYKNVSLKKQTSTTCGDYSCGGFNANGDLNQCPSTCKCGEVDPMIPDAPSKCIPK